ncbi:ABC transporter ATP-binding protein [Actinomadura opuntiae]|uniref:ABC transporter ATP-binding protein n=1 Tax=Actinomadura sp. OS1-43 TaxID=604315 RepID=UPI00255A96B9|nr:ABC transporter ATP-binding protein [Actinomadura sp. OS1-43]MDL4817202.1 ABC transporter ATP-binding protein [Actinomadura sp. OS1-43]
MNATAAVALVNVTKVFRQGRRTLADRIRRAPDTRREFAAIDGMNFAVGNREVFGLVGPNGAGKSTAVRVIATLLEPTRGTVEVCGIDAAKHPRTARRRLGVVLGGERSVYWKLTGRENLEYFAALYHLPPRDISRRIEEVLHDMELLDRADDYAERYSTGMRQRLSLARALLQQPAVLLLDEPTSGLDPRSAERLRMHVRRLRDAGHSVLITTHDMAEADQVCDRIAIIDRGRVARLGSPADLKRLVRATQVARVRLGLPGSARDCDLLETVGGFATVADKAINGPEIEMTLHLAPGVDLLPRLVEAGTRHGATIRGVDIEPVTLHDVFLAVTAPGESG